MASNGTVSGLPPIPPDIADGTVPLLIGVLLDFFLFGVLTMQTFVYYTSFPDDQLYAKILVYSSYILELVQVSFAAANIHFWFGAGFGNLIALNDVHLSPFDTPLIGSMVAFIVQLFFCYRIWVLRFSNRNLYIFMAGFIAVISVFQLVGGVTGSVIAYTGKTFANISTSRPALILEIIWLFGEALADVLIAGTMTYLLLGAGSDADQYVTYPSVANRLVRLVVQTNSLTAGAAVVALVLRMGWPGKVYFVLPTFLLGKLYSNTLLATFNHRIFLRSPPRNGSSRGIFRSVEVSKAVDMPLNSFSTSTTGTKHAPQPSFSSVTSGKASVPLVPEPVPPAPRPPRPLPRIPGGKSYDRHTDEESPSSVIDITSYSRSGAPPPTQPSKFESFGPTMD